jgi:hypothetical protein
MAWIKEASTSNDRAKVLWLSHEGEGVESGRMGVARGARTGVRAGRRVMSGVFSSDLVHWPDPVSSWAWRRAWLLRYVYVTFSSLDVSEQYPDSKSLVGHDGVL